MGGLKWEIKGTKNILNEEVYVFKYNNNYILFETRRGSILFKIKSKK